MAVDSSFTKTYNIVDSPGSQTAKQAILWNEANLDDLITAFNAHTHLNTTETLTNKTIDADNNTISNIEHGAECDNPTSGVHGATGTIVGTSDTQTLTNKTIDGASNTLSNLETAGGISGSFVGTTDTQTLTNKTIDPASNTIDGDVLDIDMTPNCYQPDTTPAEASDADDLSAHLAGLDNVARSTQSACIHRPLFSKKDADEIYIGPGRYYITNGTTDYWVYWDSTLEVQFAGLTGTQFYNVYIDYSTITGPLLTNANFIASTTDPTYTVARGGHYNGSDLAIFGFKVTSGVIDAFYHDGGRFIQFDAHDGIYDGYPGTSWATQATFDAPAFCRSVQATFRTYPATSTTDAYAYFRQGGSSGSGHLIGNTYYVGDIYNVTINTLQVNVDSSLEIDLRFSSAAANARIDCNQNGWYLPRGM